MPSYGADLLAGRPEPHWPSDPLIVRRPSEPAPAPRPPAAPPGLCRMPTASPRPETRSLDRAPSRHALNTITVARCGSTDDKPVVAAPAITVVGAGAPSDFEPVENTFR